MSRESGYQFTVVSGGASETVVKDINTTVKRVVFPGTFVGTLALHNSSSGTTADPVVTFGLPNKDEPTHVDLDIQFNDGLVYEATGTPLATIVWD